MSWWSVLLIACAAFALGAFVTYWAVILSFFRRR